MRPYITLAFALLFSCSPPPPPTTMISGMQMTMTYHITIGQPLSPQQKKTIEAIIAEVFDQTNRIYNKWNPNSELSLLNQLPAGKKVAVSPELGILLTLTDKVVKATEGRFDPTIEPLQKVWKQSLEKGVLPDPLSVVAIIPAVGWEKVHFVDGVFWKDNGQVALDLGGIAKGHCVDLLTERIVAAGYPNILVEWGGEMRAAGHHPEGRPWHIFITGIADTDPDHAIDYIDLINQAVATSGDYLQFWTVDGTTYSHIFDAKSAIPLIVSKGSVCSVSVTAGTCAIADGLATAGMVFGSVEEAHRWAEKVQKEWPETTFWFVNR